MPDDSEEGLFGIGIGTKENVSIAQVDAAGKLTMAGTEGDIWGAKDGFNYVCEKLNGDGEIIVRFLGISPTNVTAKAGLMIRESLDQKSRHVFLAWTSKRLAFVSREEIGAATEISELPANSGPVWLKLSRVGDWFGAYVSKDAASWNLADWKIVKMSPEVYVGLAASGPKGQFSSQFKDLQVSVPRAEHLPVVGTGQGLLGQYYTNTDLIGTPVFSRIDPEIDFTWGLGAPLGLKKRDDFSVRWTGEIEGQFAETYTLSMETDDGARVWLDGNLVIDAWRERPLAESKCSIDLAPGQKHSIRIEFFEKEEAATARLNWSSPSTPKRVVPQSQLYAVLPEKPVQGLRANAFAALAKANTNDVGGPWQNIDIGKGASGVVVETNGVKFLRGFGNRIGGKTDVFHFLYQPMNGNGTIVVRMLNLEGKQPWAKAGLMIRESLDADSTYASMLGTVGYGLIFNYRPVAGTYTQDATDRHFDVPYWLKLVRWGNVFSGYVSTNRTDWRLVERVIIDMKQDAFVGFAICSRSDASDCQAWFDSEEILPGEPPEQFPMTGTGDGLKEEFFDNPDLVGAPGFVDITERMDFAWREKPPVPNPTSKRFSARWTGEIQARYTEPHTLRLFSLYGARVWLNEELIMDSKGRPQRDDLEAVIDMVAGQKYLLRIESYDCAEDAQGRWKWTTPSTPGRTVPQSQLYSQPTDSDNDGMPDLWEEAYKLNPRDSSDATQDIDNDGLTNVQEYQNFTNPRKSDTDGDGIPDGWEVAHGLSPRTREDGNLDPDHDGLTNLKEYRLGTDNFQADTDGDGLDDGLEAEIGGNPLVSDIQNIKTVAEAPGSTAVNYLGKWSVDGSTLLVAERGWAEYLLNVPEADCYRLEVDGLSGSALDNNKDFEILISVDGEDLGRTVLKADHLKAGSVSRLTPWLKAGEHRIRIFWDNAVWTRSFKIASVRLQQLVGLDANQNGIKDWVEVRLQTQCGVDAGRTNFSLVSPACLEGRGRYPSMMRFSGGLKPETGNDGRWFVNVPLPAVGPVTVVSSFENDGLIATNSIVWAACNLLAADDITIRQGDALRLTAQPSNAKVGQMTVNISGETNYTGNTAEPVIHRFARAGNYVVTGAYGSGKAQQSKSITVRVLTASLDPVSAAWMNKPREWQSKTTAGVILQPDSQATLVAQTGTKSTGVFDLTARQPENFAVLARVGTNGPVLAKTKVEGFRLWSGFETGLRVISTEEDGTQLLEMGIVMSPLREDVTVKVEVHAAGVIFEDGTTIRFLKSKDFDALGQAKVRFLRPESAKTSACHRTQAYQGTTLLGQYP